MNVILDTSVLISAAILKESEVNRAVRKALSLHTVLRSLPTTSELEITLSKRKFDRYFRDTYEREFFIHAYRKHTQLITINHQVSVCRDSSDNMFLELALSGKADVVITSDPDLLVLHTFQNIPIISPKEFLEKF